MTIPQEKIDSIVAFIGKNGWPMSLDYNGIVFLENCNPDGSPKEGTVDEFDDIALEINFNTGKLVSQHSATTQYGFVPMNDSDKIGGAARIDLGYHHECWVLGFHKKNPKHPALVQCAPIRITRDLNRDGKRDGDKEYSGIFGLNIHGALVKAGPTKAPKKVGGFSRGCLVRQFFTSHLKFIQRLMQSKRATGDKKARFSAYVINANQI